jgi:two-component system OmpR family response regulator
MASAVTQYAIRSPLHILIVDSDPTVALVTQRGLERILASDAVIDIAPSPTDARTRCLRGSVELLIVDPNPENSPAATLVKSLHASRPDIPVLVLTAYDTPRLRSQMRSLGVRHYLAKPVELHDLGQLVRAAVASASTFSSQIVGDGR